MGGPGSGPSPTYTIEHARELLRLMRDDGLPLVRAAKQLGIPHSRAWECIHRHEETRDAYPAAQSLVADVMAEQSLAAVEEGVTLVLDASVDAKRANAVASATRNLSDRRAWAAKMLAPDRYGDRVTHGGTIRHEAIVLLPQLQALTPPAGATPSERSELPRASARLLGDGAHVGDEG